MARTKGAKTGIYGNNIDKEQFEKLCNMFCTQDEICSFFDVSEDTLDKFCKQNYKGTFKQIYKDLINIGKTSLRRMQIKHAESNPTMAIWLGKQYLGQKDYVEATVEERFEISNDVPEDDD